MKKLITKNIRYAVKILGVWAMALVLSGCMPHSTGSTEVGVRTIKWSPFAKSGVDQKIYAPGATYFFR